MRLSASDLACRRGGRDVFAGVSFSVESGEGLTIRGRNGAGKSSLLRTVVGLVRVTAGRLDLEGGDPELTVGEQAHYLGHQDALTLEAVRSVAHRVLGPEELADLDQLIELGRLEYGPRPEGPAPA